MRQLLLDLQAVCWLPEVVEGFCNCALMILVEISVFMPFIAEPLFATSFQVDGEFTAFAQFAIDVDFTIVLFDCLFCY